MTRIPGFDRNWAPWVFDGNEFGVVMGTTAPRSMCTRVPGAALTRIYSVLSVPLLLPNQAVALRPILGIIEAIWVDSYTGVRS